MHVMKMESWVAYSLGFAEAWVNPLAFVLDNLSGGTYGW